MKRKIKILIDGLMTGFLLFQMSYSLIGEDRHKWNGIILLILFVLHNILNCGFYKNLLRGKYGPFRIFQMLLAFLAVLSMAGAMISGLSMARDIVPFVPFKLRGSTARELHMVFVYWGFTILSLHLGLHWSMALGMMKKKVPVLQTKAGRFALRTAGIFWAAYGGFAFVKRDIGLYMTLQNMFVFFDFEEPLVFFILDYLAVMGLFVWAGYYMAEWLKRFSVKKLDKPILISRRKSL